MVLPVLSAKMMSGASEKIQIFELLAISLLQGLPAGFLVMKQSNVPSSLQNFLYQLINCNEKKKNCEGYIYELTVEIPIGCSQTKACNNPVRVSQPLLL